MEGGKVGSERKPWRDKGVCVWGGLDTGGACVGGGREMLIDVLGVGLHGGP